MLHIEKCKLKLVSTISHLPNWQIHLPVGNQIKSIYSNFAGKNLNCYSLSRKLFCKYQLKFKILCPLLQQSHRNKKVFVIASN